MNNFFSKKWAPFLLIGLATLIVWGQTVTFDFVWDDTFFIRDLQSVRSVKNIPEMFTSIEAQATEPYLFRVFRPIRTAVYALLHAMDGHEIPQPWIYHLANVLGHAAVAMMLFAALARLLPLLRDNWAEGEARLWALFIALAFAVHPVVSEVVCWAKGLDDILATFFVLACLRELLKPADNRPARWLALLWFTLAVYSKESAVPFAVVPLVIYRAVHKLNWRDAAQRTFLFLFVALVYMAHRGYIIERQSQTAPLSGSYGQTLLDMLPVVIKYFRLLWGIPPFFIDYRYLKGGFAPWSPAVLVGLALLLALVAAGICAWRRPDWKLAGFGLLWVGLFMLPVSNLLPMMQYMAERFLYLPLIGWLLAVGIVAASLPRQKIVQLAAAGLIFIWALSAWDRSWIWHDEVNLFVRSSLDNPQAERVEHNAVAAILHLPQIQRFFRLDEPTGHLLVTTDLTNAPKEEVVRTCEQAYALFPQNDTITTLTGIGLAATGEPAAAVPYFQKAVQLRPKNGTYWLNLARAASDSGQFDIARPALDKALALTPGLPAALQVQLHIQWQTGDFAGAKQTLLSLQKAAPSEENAHWLQEVEIKLSQKPPP
jgi:hypothetical protein